MVYLYQDKEKGGKHVMKNYKMIRSAAQEDRCTDKGSWGSPLYCKCGCQTPIATDTDLSLDGITVTGKDAHRDAYYILSRNGVDCGRYNMQYDYIVINGVEYLGVDKNFIQPLRDEALVISTTGSGKLVQYIK
jgi:hypothetical protein